MNHTYCLPIIKNTKSEVMQAIRSNINDYGYFEIWLDYIDDLDEMFVRELMGFLQERLILLFRRKNLSKTRMELKMKMHNITLLADSVSLVDFDVFDQKDELEFLQKTHLVVKKIVSYHQYTHTPEHKELMEIIDIMDTYKPTIYKIATLCTNEQDALRLLQCLLELKKRNVKYIVLGMGEYGVVTRIFGSLWGNEMIFAPRVAVEQSAPGQLTRDQLEVIFHELKG